ncbi:MAG: PmoA family protein [Verrucomicrobiae bacterium]|nr:PmoA family protein [Verrucomicrobiae bacterium]
MKPISALWLVAALAAGCATAAEPLTVAKDDTTIKVSRGSKPLLEYRCASVPFKPYVSQMWTPNGIQVLRDSPHDHKHHHGLMFAIAADGTDFWSEKALNGKQLGRSLDGPTATANGAGFTQHLDWVATNGTVVLREQRSVFVHDAQEHGATLLTWRSQLSPGPNLEVVKLTGATYFGLGARFVQDMDQGGEFVNASGQPGDIVRAEWRLVAAKWCAYSAGVNGAPVTIVMLDNPKNPRHPARMFTISKPFAYLSATLNLWKEPMELKRGSELVLRYGFAVCDGRLSADRIEQLYERWLALRGPSK